MAHGENANTLAASDAEDVTFAVEYQRTNGLTDGHMAVKLGLCENAWRAIRLTGRTHSTRSNNAVAKFKMRAVRKRGAADAAA